MFDLKNLARAVESVAEEKHIDPKKVLEAIESSIAAAYKREYAKRSEVVRCQFDAKTGALKFWQVKTVVDATTVDMTLPPIGEELPQQEQKKMPVAKPPVTPAASDIPEEERLPRYNPDRHILIEEARVIKADAVLEEELIFPLATHDDFGRIAAQTAKQVVLQRLREAERESILTEFQNREGEIVSGLVQRIEHGNTYIDLGRAIGVLFYNEGIPGEHYRVGERLRFLLLAVQDDARLPSIILSRAHPKFIHKLFEIEVPEIADGSVEIKGIAREPGSRTKLAVVSHAQGIDPVGSCVGQRGTRVMALSNELGQEKLDIIEWSENPAEFIGHSLSPAKTTSVEILPRNEARVFVPDDQLSLAIGRGGQNVRLAARLTGWKIDVRSQTRPDEVQQSGTAAAPQTNNDAVGSTSSPQVDASKAADEPLAADNVEPPTPTEK